MFLNIDYAKRAADREKNSITSMDIDDDIDYEQLFNDDEISIDNQKIEIKKPIKRVRFAPIIDENSLTPTLSRSSSTSSVRPTFEIEFDFDSIVSPSNELNNKKINENSNWKNAFLTDLSLAKKQHQPTTIISSQTINQNENKINNDTLWDFMKESNPKLLEKLENTNNDKQKRIDRFSTQQTTITNKINNKINKTIPIAEKEVSPIKPSSISEVVFKQPEPSNISIIEICLENDEFNQVHEEFLQFLLPYHKILCENNLWPQEYNFTSPNISLELIKNICENKYSFNLINNINRSDILKYLMFIYTITSFLYVFAYCSLQTAIRHVENLIVQNMKNVCIDQECGKPLFDLLTKTHQKFENILHPKILHIKNIFIDFFNKRRQLINTIKQLPEPKFLLLVQYESIELLHDIEHGLCSIIELHSYIYDKQNNITRDEFNDLLMYNNMIIIRTRQISPTVLLRPKRLTLIIEYEYGEQIKQWYRLCQQYNISYLAYKTILPSFIAPESIDIIEKKSSPIIKEEFINLPTIVLARPLVDNFKLLRTLECRHDISIITRDYHLLEIPIDQQPDILIDWITSMLIFDLNRKLDINLVRQKIQSMTNHSCHIHVAILTSGSTPDFILSTYITPITQLSKQIQEIQSNIDIQIKSFSSLDEFANHVAQLVQQKQMIKCILTPTPSWNEKMLLRRCSSLNSISAQLIIQRLKNVDLSTVNLDLLINQCPEIPMIYLKIFLSDMHKNF